MKRMGSGRSSFLWSGDFGGPSNRAVGKYLKKTADRDPRSIFSTSSNILEAFDFGAMWQACHSTKRARSSLFAGAGMEEAGASAGHLARRHASETKACSDRETSQ